jgi:diguanylate cyclase (GGDEF)-like protein
MMTADAMDVSAGSRTPIGDTRSQATGTALRPVINLSHQIAIGYEAQPRPRGACPWPNLVTSALANAELVAPAALFVQLPASVSDMERDPTVASVGRSAAAGQVVWVVARQQGAELRLGGRRTSPPLPGNRFALDGVGLRSVHHLAELRPEFAILRPGVVAAIQREPTACAELAGLVAVAARLDVCLVARGVGDQGAINALLSVGVGHGLGAAAGPPLVLDAALAGRGDRVVSEAWLRRQESLHLRQSSPEPPPPQIGDLTSVPHGGGDDGRFAQTLGDAARALQAEHDPERILATVAEFLPRTVPCSSLAIFEADWEHDRMLPRLAVGPDARSLGDLDFPMSSGITGWAFARGVPHLSANASQHPAATLTPGTQRNAQSMIVVPLVAGNHRLGVLDVWRDGAGSFSERDLARCALLGHVIAAAWRNAQLYAELEERSRTDALTGLHNARWWQEIALKEVARSRRSGAEIGLLLIDLDHFKQVNDTAGHPVGDRVLRQVASALRSAVRTSDAVIRLGGEEFLIMLPDSGQNGALRVAEKVRERLARLSPAASGLPRITASIGVALYPRHGDSLDDVVQAADTAMYRAKEEGRDTVVTAS